MCLVRALDTGGVRTSGLTLYQLRHPVISPSVFVPLLHESVSHIFGPTDMGSSSKTSLAHNRSPPNTEGKGCVEEDQTVDSIQTPFQ